MVQAISSPLSSDSEETGNEHTRRVKSSTDSVNRQYYTMDDDLTRKVAEEDPSGFVRRLPERVILDEVQRVPDLFLEIKAAVDRDRVKGRFLLAGSSSVMSSPKVRDSLAGRMGLIRLHPLSQRELNPTLCVGDEFLNLLFQCQYETTQYPFDSDSLPERMLKGGYPQALGLSNSNLRNQWFMDKIVSVCQHDIMDLTRIHNLELIPDILKTAAEQNAQLFNIQKIAKALGVSWPAMRDYITLLKKVYLLDELQPWHKTLTKRLIRTPKIHFGDTGLASALLRIDSNILETDRELFARTLENLVYTEIVRQSSWRNEWITLSHYRDKDQNEVDIVIELGGRRIFGIDVKASHSIRRSDFRGLRRLRAISGDRFVAGAVLYCGDMCIAFERNMFALPIGILWD